MFTMAMVSNYHNLSIGINNQILSNCWLLRVWVAHTLISRKLDTALTGIDWLSKQRICKTCASQAVYLKDLLHLNMNLSINNKILDGLYLAARAVESLSCARINICKTWDWPDRQNSVSTRIMLLKQCNSRTWHQ